MGLEGARLYLVAPRRLKAGDLADLIPELVAAGVDIVQLREKELAALALLRAAESIVSACRSAGIPFVINDRPDIAAAVGADGVHLGQEDLPVELARPIVGPTAILGRSTHSEMELETECARPGVDYIGVGPVEATPTKPGRPGTGYELVRFAAERATLPWFVTGGMAPETIEAALEAGARRVVVVRALVTATDPVEVAARLRTMLDRVPL